MPKSLQIKDYKYRMSKCVKKNQEQKKDEKRFAKHIPNDISLMKIQTKP